MPESSLTPSRSPARSRSVTVTVTAARAGVPLTAWQPASHGVRRHRVRLRVRHGGPQQCQARRLRLAPGCTAARRAGAVTVRGYRDWATAVTRPGRYSHMQLSSVYTSSRTFTRLQASAWPCSGTARAGASAARAGRRRIPERTPAAVTVRVRQRPASAIFTCRFPDVTCVWFRRQCRAIGGPQG